MTAPTRKNISRLQYHRNRFSDNWVEMETPPWAFGEYGKTRVGFVVSAIGMDARD